MAPSPQAGSQMSPSKLSTESKARVASGGVGKNSKGARHLYFERVKSFILFMSVRSKNKDN